MATNLSNQANIRYTYSTSGSGSAVSNTTTTTLVDEYSMSATKTSLKGTYRPGENLTYLIRIENNGSGSLYNVTVFDDLGSTSTNKPLSYVNGSAYLLIDDVYTSISPVVSSNGITFILPSTLQSEEVAVIIYMVKVSDTLSVSVTRITNKADVTACAGSTTGAQICVKPDPKATVTAEDYAQVTIMKEADKSVVSTGESLIYTFTLTNTGNEAATGVILTDELPIGFSVSGIQSVTNGVITTYSAGDYSVNPTTHVLTLPCPQSGHVVTVPAATVSGPGLTTIIVSGMVS